MPGGKNDQVTPGDSDLLPGHSVIAMCTEISLNCVITTKTSCCQSMHGSP